MPLAAPNPRPRLAVASSHGASLFGASCGYDSENFGAAFWGPVSDLLNRVIMNPRSDDHNSILLQFGNLRCVYCTMEATELQPPSALVIYRAHLSFVSSFLATFSL